MSVKMLGEQLVLFSDDEGRVGLLALHCSCPGTYLSYGSIEKVTAKLRMGLRLPAPKFCPTTVRYFTPAVRARRRWKFVSRSSNRLKSGTKFSYRVRYRARSSAARGPGLGYLSHSLEMTHRSFRAVFWDRPISFPSTVSTASNSEEGR